jgi:hypothetical protein
MTRKHYAAIARVIADNYDLARRMGADTGMGALENVTEDLARIFALDSERFDRERFIAACGVELDRIPVRPVKVPTVEDSPLTEQVASAVQRTERKRNRVA